MYNSETTTTASAGNALPSCFTVATSRGSAARYLDADRLALRNDLAIPFRAETGIRPLLRTDDRSNGTDAQQRHDEYDTENIRTGRIPLKPFHFLILAQRG
jgi:hypothetical protein